MTQEEIKKITVDDLNYMIDGYRSYKSILDVNCYIALYILIMGVIIITLMNFDINVVIYPIIAIILDIIFYIKNRIEAIKFYNDIKQINDYYNVLNINIDIYKQYAIRNRTNWCWTVLFVSLYLIYSFIYG